MISPFSTKHVGGLLVAAAVLMAGGCSREKAAGTVAGKVTYNGLPVSAGSVNFISTSGVAASSKIDASGNFRIEEPLQAGEYKVFISPPAQEPTAPGTKATAAEKFEVPPKFREPGTSGIVVTVKAGKNEVPVQFND